VATELAKAYVQIVPSAKGIKGSLAKELGGETDSAGASAGQSFGEKMMGALKGIIVAAGIGKALSAAITEGAALEQSIGGIETLFKESAEKVKANAAEAYRTAGMSANEYMELTTSFSASLLQSLGNDTAKAADVADMAMTDMSDNANKMGTSMEDIKNAYQGFAKQNYTMLDNLKLGYGGTKTEMERLLTDAEKITGVKYDIGNLSDVYSAIHVIQGELDITGTTAKEAASTISGSMSSMKAAFKNVLGQLTIGQDVGPALSALAKTVTTFLLGNLLPAVWNILSALPGALVTFIQEALPQLVSAFMEFLPRLQEGFVTGGPQLLQMAVDIVTQLCDGITTMWPQILQRGGEIITQLVSGLSGALPQVFQMALDIITTLINTFVENFPQYIQTGTDILMSLIGGIRQSLPQMLVAAAEAILSMVTGLINNFPQILAAGFDMIVSLITGIGSALPDIIAAAFDVAKSIWDTILKIDWLQLGKDIIQGMINGIGAMAGAVWDAAVNIAKSAFDAICTFFGINSPSTLMRDEVGKYVPAGVAVGIEGNTRPVIDAMDNLADLASGSIQSELATNLRRNRHGQAQQAAAPAAYGPVSNNQTFNFYQPVETPDETARAIRLQMTYGLAGDMD